MHSSPADHAFQNHPPTAASDHVPGFVSDRAHALSATSTARPVPRAIRNKALFRLRYHYWIWTASTLRALYWRALGMQIGPQTKLSAMRVTWPHRVVLGARCSLEHAIYFNVAGGYAEDTAITVGDGTFIGSGCEFNIVSRLTVGPACLIASGTRFIDHNHGMDLGPGIKEQPETRAPITLGAGVWIGANCIILKGVTVGDGAILAAGSVLTTSVPPNAIYAGVPARLLRNRR